MNRVQKLEQEILRHKKLYYGGSPEISDSEFDNLEEELRALKPNSSALKQVGYLVNSDQKIKHEKKMLSLQKTYNSEELLDWINQRDVISTFKIDGSSCSLIYENGEIVLGKTRGDGTHGENITKKVLQILDIPKSIQDQNKLEVRGEIFCTEESFFLLSKEMENRGLERPTSQRNIVAGLLGRKENHDLCRFLSFKGFELFHENKDFLKESDKLHYLKKLKIPTEEFELHKSSKSVLGFLKLAEDFISSGEYLIDGAVFSFDDLRLHQSLGETQHHPRYKMAFKFQGIAKVTKILDIEWSLSRNGIFTPVAIVEPVELSGAVVSRVTLHNYGVVEQYQLKPNDLIEVVRSGEVIPKFLSVIKSSAGEVSFPLRCPFCKTKTTILDIRLLCSNQECPEVLKQQLVDFVRKIGIDDLNVKRIEEMLRAKLIKDIPTLYDLNQEALMTLDKVRDKLAAKIIKNIEASKKQTLVNFLASLGISGGAISKCEKIVDAGYDSLEKIMDLNAEDLENIDSFAQKSSIEFIKSLEQKKTLIKELIQRGFKFEKVIKKEAGVLAGKKFCITGTLSLKRSEIQNIIKKNSGEVVSSVSLKTDYVVTNDTQSNSAKFKKAQELKIPIINEEKLFQMVK